MTPAKMATLTVVDSASAMMFLGSQSAPDLRLDMPTTLTASSQHVSPNHNTIRSEATTAAAKHKRRLTRQELDAKDLPSLPVFDIATFDLDFGSESDFLSTPRRATPPVSMVAGTSDDTLVTVKPAPSAQSPKAVTAPPKMDRIGRSRSFIDRPRSWLSITKTDLTPRSPEENGNLDASPQSDEARRPATARERPHDRTHSLFVDTSKRPFISLSRSPSPLPKENGRKLRRIGSRQFDRATEEQPVEAPVRPKSRSGLLGPKRPAVAKSHKSEGDTKPTKSSTPGVFNSASNYFSKLISRPSLPKSASTNTSVVPPVLTSVSEPSLLPPSLSGSHTRLTSSSLMHVDQPTARLSSHTASSTSDESTGATENSASTSSTQTSTDSTVEVSASDPQWEAFRRLDAEFELFTSRTNTTQRITVIRQSLAPFLANTTEDDRYTLTPDDYERRTTILSKWWSGLLDLVNGSGAAVMSRSGMAMPAVKLQPVAGVDRPGLLDIIIQIMVRPEWRALTPYFRPLKDRSPKETVHAPTMGNPFLEHAKLSADHAEYNVRSMFVENLLNQMAIAVDKMSSRHTPTSLVAFCGKTCAYAFFFVPGIAEVSCRLWGLNSELLRRIADEFGLPRRSRGESDDIVSLFPPTLHKLGWTSVKSMTENLRLTTKLSAIAAKIPWHGPWVPRWRGVDTDLLFIFCKYYYILAEEFMPMELPLFEKARAPAFALIHAQLLSTLDNTIHHRDTAMDTMLGVPLFDAPMDPEGMLLTPQLPTNNILKDMKENRLIVLLQDILAENSARRIARGAKDTFADAFVGILKAATKKVPACTSTAVVVVMDFLQEVVFTFDKYAKSVGSLEAFSRSRPTSATALLDWQFWLTVIQRIMESQHTMSEARVLSFLYTTWDILALDPARKHELTCGWLLTDEMFDRFFTNCAPVVRAYYMRLLCWRICRWDRDTVDADKAMFTLASKKLKQVFSHYLWLKETAAISGKIPPSTIACLPQPGRRFLIMRMSVPTSQLGVQADFDSPSTSFGSNSNDDSAGSPTSLLGFGDFGGNRFPAGGGGARLQADTSAKKKWSLLGKVLNLTTTMTPTAAGTATAVRRLGEDEFEAMRRMSISARTGTGTGLVAPQQPTTPTKRWFGSMKSLTDDEDSSASPAQESTKFLFRFTLGTVPWHDSGKTGENLPLAGYVVEHLDCPVLPGPAQASIGRSGGGGGGGGALIGGHRGRAARRPRSPVKQVVDLPEDEDEGGAEHDDVEVTALSAEETDGAPGVDFDQFEQTNLTAVRSTSPSQSIQSFSLWEGDGYMSRSNDTATDIASTDDKTTHINNNDDNNTTTGPRYNKHAHNSNDASTIVPTGFKAVRPSGLYLERATYTGRALAEWSIIVNECDAFVDRRCDEGVLSLKDVEVPELGFEGIKRVA